MAMRCGSIARPLRLRRGRSGCGSIGCGGRSRSNPPGARCIGRSRAPRAFPIHGFPNSADAGSARCAAADDWAEHRLRLGVTEGVAELGSGETLWLECNAAELGGVSFTKGCYVGPENTARMHYRSTINRRLVVAALGGAGKRTRATSPAFGMMVEHRRRQDLGDALR